MAKRAVDEFSNIVYASVEETAANTLTYERIETGYGSLQKTAWIINRIEWFLDPAILEMLDLDDDVIRLALSTSDIPASLDISQAPLIDLMEITIELFTAVGFIRTYMPVTRDFSSLPGGGKLVLPYPLYVAAQGVSLANPITGSCRIYFTEREMKDQEWMELVQQTRLLS